MMLHAHHASMRPGASAATRGLRSQTLGQLQAPVRRPVTAAAGLQEQYGTAPGASSEGGYMREGGGYRQQQGGRGGGRGGRGGYNNDRGGYRNYNNDRSYSSSEEGGGGSGEYRPRGDRGGRGGGGYRGGDRNNSGGGGGRERQQLSEEKLSQNNRIAEAQSWRQLNMLLEAGDGGAGMDGFQLSALLLKAAKMQVADNADEQADFQQFIAKVYGLLLEALPNCRPRQLASALQGVAQLQLYNEQLVGSIMQRCLDDFDRFGPNDLSLVIRSCAQLGVAPPPEFMALFWARPFEPSRPNNRRENARFFAADDMVNLIDNLVKLGLAPPAEWMAGFVAAASQAAAEVRSKDYLRLLLALASCGWRPDDAEAFKRLVERSFPMMQYMQVDQLSQLVWAFTQFQAPLPEQWGVAFNSKLRSQRRFIRPAQLGTLLYSLAYLRMPPPPDALEGFLEDLQIQFLDATGDDMANVAMALAQFQHKPRDRWLDDFLVKLRSKLATTSAAGLNTVVGALPALSTGVRAKEVVADAQRRLEAQQAAAAAAAEQQQQAAAAADAAAYAGTVQ